jgi:hypothetical protein
MKKYMWALGSQPLAGWIIEWCGNMW